MLIKLLFVVCFYICAPIMFFMYLNEVKPKKNIILGTTIPITHQNDEQVKNITDRFKKSSTIVFIVFTVLIALCLVPSHTSITLFLTLIWLPIDMVAQTIPYIKANKALRKIKAENGWHGEKKTAADLKLSDIKIKVPSPYLSMIPLVISLLPLIYVSIFGRDDDSFVPMLWTYISMPACIILDMVIHIIIAKRKSDVIGEDTDVNLALTTIRRRNWSKMFLGLNSSIAIIALFMWAGFTLNSLTTGWIFIALIVLTVLIVSFAMYIEFDTRDKQYKFTANLSENNYLDEDDYWIYGIFYYNPHDSHFMIPDRVGTNTTVNLAKTSGKIFMALTALVIAALPFLGVWLMVEEFTPMKLEKTDTAIVATHVSEEYNVPFSEIRDLKETTEEPKVTNKISGYASDGMMKGKFSVKDYGTCEVFISPDADEYIIAKTDDRTYIFGY